jgi:hypothetical protein
MRHITQSWWLPAALGSEVAEVTAGDRWPPGDPGRNRSRFAGVAADHPPVRREYRTEELADIRFAPLVGEAGWAPTRSDETPPVTYPASLSAAAADEALAIVIARECEPFSESESANIGPLLQRIGDARIVLLGETTHGTLESCRMRRRAYPPSALPNS